MRVCIVISYDLAEEGGVKRHAVHLAESLRKEGDEVWVIGPSSGDPLGHGEQVRGFPGVVNIPSNGSDNHLGIFTPPWQVARFFRAHRFDVVHIHEPLVPTLSHYSLWSSPRAAHVCTFHGFNETEGLLSKSMRQLWSRLLFHRYERAIAVSEPAARFARYTWRGPLQVIPNGVPTSTFVPGEPWGGDGKQRPLKLLFVGHWRDGRKGLPFLLDAHALLRRRGLDVTLDVIGEGPSGQPAPSVEGVTFHGAISSEETLARHYQSCDVFVAPASGQESFGIVLLEAMACACPIVCSDIEGYRRVVSQDGARLAAAGSATSLADEIARLAGDPAQRRRMGEVNRALVAQYDWDRLARRVRDEYLAAIERRHGVHRDG